MIKAVGLIGISSLEYFGKVKRVSKAQALGFGYLKGHGGNLLGISFPCTTSHQFSRRSYFRSWNDDCWLLPRNRSCSNWSRSSKCKSCLRYPPSTIALIFYKLEDYLEPFLLDFFIKHFQKGIQSFLQNKTLCS